MAKLLPNPARAKMEKPMTRRSADVRKIAGSIATGSVGCLRLRYLEREP